MLRQREIQFREQVRSKIQFWNEPVGVMGMRRFFGAVTRTLSSPRFNLSRNLVMICLYVKKDNVPLTL